MSAREKIAYLRGLIEGQNVSENASMTKFHEALLGALGSIAEEIDELNETCDYLREYVEDLKDEMTDMHKDGDSDLAEECGCGCEDEEEEYEATTCPNCGKDFFYQPDAYDDDEDLLCPYCGDLFKQ
jgi:DNA-directed RNA polymerase subunit RPC12/RpoP